MALVEPLRAAPNRFIEAAINYTSRSAETAVLYEFDRESSTHIFETHVVRIEDARPMAGTLSLDQHGFILAECPTAVTDFYDSDQVHDIYFREVEALVRALTGAEIVLVFGEALRSEGPDARTPRRPARNAHVDFNAATVRRFVEAMVEQPKAQRLLRQRFALINLWRPIRPIEQAPLALCDATTVSAADLMLGEIGHKPGEDPPIKLEGFNVAHNPAHRWHYFPDMQPDELLVFKLCDSDEDRAQWTAHTAFDDPSSPPDAAARESIEVRTIAFFPA
jgi:hypothetical protein